jgi:2-polyprenyl-3-methyl-5-hydroxy-6-metoxy-1,4-benzoquinol methylase
MLMTDEKTNPYRDGIAKETIRDIKVKFQISFKDKRVLDVGCRSGENTIAMMNEGADVIGIDPDDSEFSVALSKGMAVNQLFKKTLQQFVAENPGKKFDIVTVFLWCIYPIEYESFTSALATIVKPEGCVIIGLHESIYLDHWSGFCVSCELIKKFKKFEAISCENATANREIFLCTNPKI